MTSILEKTGAMPAPNSETGVALAWSEEDSLSEAERASLFGIHSEDFPALDSGEITALEHEIELSPSINEAMEVIDRYETGIYHKMALLEKVMSVHGNSAEVTDRIDKIVDKTIGGADLAIAGEVETTAPNDAVLGLIKGLDITSDPNIKARVANLLDSGIDLAEQNNHTYQDGSNYLLDPIIAASAKEVVADIRHASPNEDIAAESLFESHSRVHALHAERVEIEAQSRARLAEIDQEIANEYEVIKTIAPKQTFMTAVKSMLRFSR